MLVTLLKTAENTSVSTKLESLATSAGVTLGGEAQG